MKEHTFNPRGRPNCEFRPTGLHDEFKDSQGCVETPCFKQTSKQNRKNCGYLVLVEKPVGLCNDMMLYILFCCFLWHYLVYNIFQVKSRSVYTCFSMQFSNVKSTDVQNSRIRVDWMYLLPGFAFCKKFTQSSNKWNTHKDKSFC